MADRTSTPTATRVRATAARVLGAACTTIAILIVLAIITVAARDNINEDNVLVRLVTGVAHALDGPFSPDGGIFSFSGPSGTTRDALVNWGIAAAAWLLVGRLASALVRPR